MYRLPNSLRTAAMIDTQIAIHAQPLVESQVAIPTCSARYIACYIAYYCIGGNSERYDTYYLVLRPL
jgi:hypothetical protein